MRTHTPHPPANLRHLCALRKLQRLRPTVLDLFPGRGENVENMKQKQDVKISPSGALNILRSLSSRHVSVN
ncbi:hypothetical protein C0J50_5407 [Silurus asotus]|uniref:Uncharacterized protein n=1 Tax=Silurus asotus TaxID=30991 RepID=A0AAD5A4X8_SILAS|nr:hypothetical protein C0J50_5407 [Silurus asotus]